MDSPVGFAEYSVKKQFVGAYRKRRIILIVCFILSPIAVFPILNLLVGQMALYMLPPTLAVLTVAIAIPLYRRLCMIEYDYRVQIGEPASGGQLDIAEIYHKSRRKEILSVTVSELEEIAPYSGKYLDIAHRRCYERLIDASSSADSENAYFAIIPENDDRGSILLIFEPTDRMLKIMYHLNRRTVLRKQ